MIEHNVHFKATIQNRNSTITHKNEFAKDYSRKSRSPIASLESTFKPVINNKSKKMAGQLTGQIVKLEDRVK